MIELKRFILRQSTMKFTITLIFLVILGFTQVHSGTIVDPGQVKSEKAGKGKLYMWLASLAVHTTNFYLF